MRTWVGMLIGAGALLGTASSLGAEKPKETTPAYVVSIGGVKQGLKKPENVYEVVADLTAADVTGRGAAGLGINDIKVTDGGGAVSNLHVEPAAGERRPTAAVVLVDISSSMLKASKLERAKEAASRFVAGAGPDDQILVMTFFESVTPLGGFTNDKAVLNAQIEGIETASDRATQFYDALDLATRQLELKNRKEFPRRLVLALTDADDSVFRLSMRGSMRVREESIIDAKLAGIAVHAVAYGADADVDTLELFAEETNGLVCNAEQDDPDAFVAALWTEGGGRYRLRYTLSPDRLAGVAVGQTRNLEVTLTRVAQTPRASKAYRVVVLPPEGRGDRKWGLYILGGLGVVTLVVVFWVALGGRRRRKRSPAAVSGPILPPEPTPSAGEATGVGGPTSAAGVESPGTPGETATAAAEGTRAATGGWFEPAAGGEGWGTLIVAHGPADKGKRFPLTKESVTLGLGGVGDDGREITVDIRFADPQKARVVSRFHAVIKRVQGRVRVEDRSTNGTYVWRDAGRKWERFGEVEVVPGDYICLGDDTGYILKFERGAARAAGRGDETVIAR